jgi:hypothetical protein
MLANPVSSNGEPIRLPISILMAGSSVFGRRSRAMADEDDEVNALAVIQSVEYLKKYQ